jgi:hypothetical protein
MPVALAGLVDHLQVKKLVTLFLLDEAPAKS